MGMKKSLFLMRVSKRLSIILKTEKFSLVTTEKMFIKFQMNQKFWEDEDQLKLGSSNDIESSNESLYLEFENI